MKKFFTTVKQIFSVEPLRRRIFYTMLFATIYRLGTFVVLPWVDVTKISQHSQSFWDPLVGTALGSFSIFSLGVSPYISASIIIQLASFALPYFQRLQQEGMSGHAKLNRITRYFAVLMAIIQGTMQVLNISSGVLLNKGGGSLFWFYVVSVLLMTAGSMVSIWLADLITEKGLANGASVLIMVGIISKLPVGLAAEVRSRLMQGAPFFLAIELILLFVIVLITVVFMQGTRKIPLQYARQMASVYSHGGGCQYLPIKINATGVMPIIFANVFVGVVTFLSSFAYDKFGFSFAKSIANALQARHGWKCSATKAVLIFVGTLMYASVFINPVKIANELKRNNGFIPGVKPGRPTAKYIDKTMSRILLPSALFLAFIAMLPAIVFWEPIGVCDQFCDFYGGTSMLIIIGVMIEMVNHIEGHLNMVYYDNVLQEKKDLPEL